MNFLEEIKALLKEYEVGTIAIVGFICGFLFQGIFGSTGVILAVAAFLVYKYRDVFTNATEPKVQANAQAPVMQPSVSI